MSHDTPDNKRNARRATAWRHDQSLENAIRLRGSDPAAYDRLNPTTRIAVGYYESAKAAAQRAGIDTTTPTTDGDAA